MSFEPRVAALEQRYIELLQQKIAILEDQVGSNLTPGSKLSNLNPQTAKLGNGGNESPTTSVLFRLRKYNDEGSIEETDVPSASVTKQPETNATSTQYAMTLLRGLSAKGQYSYTMVTIQDDGLKALLFYVLSHHPLCSHWERMSFTGVFEPFVHNWSRLKDIVDNDESKPIVVDLHKDLRSVNLRNRLVPLRDSAARTKAVADLKELLQLVRDTPDLEPYFSDVGTMHENADVVAFNYIWTVFHPGEVVISRSFMGQLQAFIVKESSFETEAKTNKRLWNLICWTYDWNGSEFNRVSVKFIVEEYKGSKNISSLICYPIKHYEGTSDDHDTLGKVENPEELRHALIRRGRRFRELCLKKEGSQYFEYDGFALSSEHGARRQYRRTTISTGYRGPSHVVNPSMGDLEFVVDNSCRCSECMGNERLKDNQKAHFDHVKPSWEWEEYQYLISPPRLLGYHLTTKQWVELAVDKVKDIKILKDPSAFKSLELPKTQKSLIESLVRCHGVKDEDRSMRDLMKGKGNGLVILLHGPPGVGKTLTAESLAKATGKPLFSVGVSEIGLEIFDVEGKLRALFELAAIWRAVMLFDEADVFLESRSSNTSDLERSALVSILLRVLEYYDGILILTTNRLKSFDIAVQSRVNLAIRYNSLSDEQKKAIYRNFVNQLNEDNADDKEDLLQFVEDAEDESPFRLLNGRQIRNVLFSAASLAQAEPGKRLRREHIEKILKETIRFQQDTQNMVNLTRQDAEVGFRPG
ncbi:MAG: hypothetical protein Q9195_005657 [Heterodermia aff. obscurata]